MIVVIITIQDNHFYYQSPSQSTSFDDNRLGLSLPALGDEDRKNMFAAMDENGDGAISFNEWLDFSMKTIVAQIQ